MLDAMLLGRIILYSSYKMNRGACNRIYDTEEQCKENCKNCKTLPNDAGSVCVCPTTFVPVKNQLDIYIPPGTPWYRVDQNREKYFTPCNSSSD